VLKYSVGRDFCEVTYFDPPELLALFGAFLSRYGSGSSQFGTKDAELVAKRPVKIYLLAKPGRLG
jgi:hypothetical protein